MRCSSFDLDQIKTGHCEQATPASPGCGRAERPPQPGRPQDGARSDLGVRDPLPTAAVSKRERGRSASVILFQLRTGCFDSAQARAGQSAQPSPAVAAIDRHMTARDSRAHQRASWSPGAATAGGGTDGRQGFPQPYTIRGRCRACASGAHSEGGPGPQSPDPPTGSHLSGLGRPAPRTPAFCFSTKHLAS